MSDPCIEQGSVFVCIFPHLGRQRGKSGVHALSERGADVEGEARWVEKVLPCLHLHCVKRQGE